MAPQCSGYEGMGLVTIFTAFYLSVYRHYFRFPQALLLFPIGIITIWLFNVVKIAILISIGASVSPAIAIEGFHSQAGWIFFIIVIVGILILAYKTPYFIRLEKTDNANSSMTLAMALQIPFIVLLTTTILTQALSAGFDWVYPIRVIGVGMALVFCWKLFRFSRIKFNLEPWLVGIAVFLIWIVLVPEDAETSQTFVDHLVTQSELMVVVWLLFRIMGAVVTVPIAEELLFRGYFFSRLASKEIVLEGPVAYSAIAFFGSSLLFGLLHSNWVAGVIAGLIFGLVRYRSESVKEPIIAHAFTNLLLTIYVLLTGYWSVW
jgi:exosortase E/protease (VPEID-CTERM system)